MIEYLAEGRKYLLSYSELREKYLEFIQLNDNEFMNKLHEAIHLSCIICFLKEIPTYVCLRDDGIIHQLVHLLDINEDTVSELSEIRDLFKNQLKLSYIR